ncbi:hypothetical protein [Nocardioides salsibiostraticola]
MSDPKHLLSRLRGLPTVPATQITAVLTAVEALLQAPWDPNVKSTPIKPARPPNDDILRPANDVGKAQDPADFSAASHFLDELQTVLSNRGARLIVPEDRNQTSVMVPDLIAWVDGLQTPWGLPLCIEVVARASTPPKIRKRLVRMMESAGVRSLLIVSLQEIAPSSWSDGLRMMLTVSKSTLLGALANADVAGALSAILDEAAHGLD